MAERLTIYAEAREDIAVYKKIAEVLSGITKVSQEEYTNLVHELGALGKGTQ